MTSTQTIFYLLLGVAAVGVLLAILVLVLQRAHARLDDREDEGEEEASDAVMPQGIAVARPTDVPATGEFPATVAQGHLHPSARGTVGPLPVGRFAVRASTASDIGARKEQQDAIAIGSQEPEFVKTRGFLTVICDGMGGMSMGAQAAEVATQTFVQAFERSQMPVFRALREAAEQANARVLSLNPQEEASSAGTTLVCTVVTEKGFHYLSVGDSHAYLLRGGVLSQLNVDHNYLSELLQRVRRGEITREEALSDPERAHLTSYLGVRKLHLVDQSIEPLELEPGDRLVLASDGLFKVLSPEEIAGQLVDYDEASAQRLMDAALARRHRNQDNISVVVVAVDEAQEGSVA